MAAEVLPERPALTDDDAKLAELDSIPLFMKSLPAGLEDENNTGLAALQNLAYEGTPDGAPTPSLAHRRHSQHSLDFSPHTGTALAFGDLTIWLFIR